MWFILTEVHSLFSNHRTSCRINNLLSGFGLFNVLAPTTEKAIRNFLIHVFPGKVQLLTTAHQMTMPTERSTTSFHVGLHGTQSQTREFGCMGDWFEHSCPSWSRALGGWVTTTAADPWDPGGKETFYTASWAGSPVPTGSLRALSPRRRLPLPVPVGPGQLWTSAAPEAGCARLVAAWPPKHRCAGICQPASSGPVAVASPD